jgi:hypothetical protein
VNGKGRGGLKTNCAGQRHGKEKRLTHILGTFCNYWRNFFPCIVCNKLSLHRFGKVCERPLGTTRLMCCGRPSLWPVFY